MKLLIETKNWKQTINCYDDWTINALWPLIELKEISIHIQEINIQIHGISIPINTIANYAQRDSEELTDVVHDYIKNHFAQYAIYRNEFDTYKDAKEEGAVYQIAIDPTIHIDTVKHIVNAAAKCLDGQACLIVEKLRGHK